METQTTETTQAPTKTTVRPGVRKITGTKPAAKVAAKKTATAKVAPKNTITKVINEKTGLSKELNLKQLCNELSKELKVDIDPRMARRKLRKAKITGHDFRDRWTFLRDSTAHKAAIKALTPAAGSEE